MIKLGYPIDYFTNITQWFGIPHASTRHFYEELGLLGHNGIDWRCAVGTQVKAMHDGVVRIKTYGDGNMTVFIYDYDNNIMTLYCHLSKYLVKKDQFVKKGEVIALSGNTGKYTTGAHLHTGLYLLDKKGNVKNANNGWRGAVDIAPYLADELKEFDLVKTLQDPKVYEVRNKYLWWIKSPETYKKLLGKPVNGKDIKDINLITYNEYEYGGDIG